ncbi:MAG: LTA synthase family protein [Eubacteriales bacterium]
MHIKKDIKNIKNIFKQKYENAKDEIKIATLVVFFIISAWLMWFSGFTASSFNPVSRIIGNTALAFLLSYILYALFQYKSQKYSNIVFAIIVILGSFFILEFSIGNVSLNDKIVMLTPVQTVLNLAIYFGVWIMLISIFRKRSIAAIITITLAAAIAIGEIYLIKFRGRVILPMDIFALKTVANVFAKYNFTPNLSQIGIAVVYCIFIVGIIKWRKKHGEKDIYEAKRIKTIVGVITPFLIIAIMLYTNLLGALGFQENLYFSMWDTRLNGAALNFIVNIKYSDLEEPENYSAQQASEIIGYKSDSIESLDNYNRPNVIIIMNEAWADFSVIGLESSEDLFTGLYTYDENTISGFTYVSTFAGHTANAEYEFLTGNTMAFTPMETVAYQLYVKDGEYSLVNQFNMLGYETAAMHPYKSSGWNRVLVYDEFGFDSTYFIDEFSNPELIRGYVSDRSNYDKLIEVFESKPENQPLFMFNITMQNHGDYREKNVFKDMVYAKGYESRGNVSLYLSLIKESNIAFESLLDYFSSQDEPTVVLMFGDHFPGFGDGFYDDYFSKQNEYTTLEQHNLLYKIPFLLWSNYDIGIENAVDDISLNYLGAYLMDVLGLPMTGYQKFLMQTYSDVPIINRPNYMGESQEMMLQNDIFTNEQIDILEKYKIVQYCGIEDRANREDKLFFLDTEDMH